MNQLLGNNNRYTRYVCKGVTIATASYNESNHSARGYIYLEFCWVSASILLVVSPRVLRPHGGADSHHGVGVSQPMR